LTNNYLCRELRLIGKKKFFFFFKIKRHIATLFVKGGTLQIESKYQNVKKDLENRIDRLIQEGGPWIGHGFWKENTHILMGKPQKPKDEYFLEALQDSHELWWENTFGDYHVNKMASRVEVDKE